MKNWKKLVCLLVAAVMALGMLAGCGGSDNPAPAEGNEPAAAPAEGGEQSAPADGEPESAGEDEHGMFNIALTAAFSGFDPLRTNDSASTYVNAQIYETLYRIDPVTGEYNCLLASALPEFSEDGLTATVKLREGVTFQDGTPFNSEAVKYTFELIQDPDFGSARASIASSIESMECPDDYTIVFHLKYEDGVLTAKLAHTNSAIVSPTAQQSQDLMVNPVGTGPYKFVSSVSGSNVVLTRNDDYWGEKPAIKDVTMTVIAEQSTALSRLETGEADFVPNVTVEDIARIESMPNAVFATSDSAQVTYLLLRGDSCKNPVMAEPEFRKAICMAIDKVGYVENMMEGYAVTAESVIGPKITGYTDEAVTHNVAYDPEGAKAILDAHPGWADEPVTFLVPTTATYESMGVYFQENLKKAGFNNIVYEPIDWAAWLTESQTENRFDITLAAWSNVTRDGTELMEPNFANKSDTNTVRIRYTGDDGETMDEYILASKTTSDMEERTTNLLAANALLQDNCYVQPVMHGTNLFAYDNAYTGITRDPGGTFYIIDFGYAE